MNNDINITSENVNTEIKRPCVDDKGVCFTSDNVKISECVIDDKGNIKGISDNGNKALYKFDDNKWYFGSDISKLNLVSLSDRTKDERLEIVKKSHEKARENREQKKNINELAKAMLEQTMTERQIKSILGDDTNVLLDSSVASVMLGAMIKSALNGSFKAFESVRDTAGYKPKDVHEINADIITESDKALIDKALKNA
jgi:hypothetical protein